MRRGTNIPSISQFNQTVILDLIRRSPNGISRAELGQQTGLSAQTASNVSKRLIETGVVVEAGTSIQGRGKPPVMLQLVPNSRFAVGVHLDPSFITYVLLNIAGDVVNEIVTRMPQVEDPAVVIEIIAAQVRDIISDLAPHTVVGVGLAVPGPIDIARGAIVHAPLMLGWDNYPLQESLQQALGLPVVMDKDVNVAATAEVWVAGGQQRQNFGFLYYGSGIGLGLAINGEVHSGPTGNAGNGGTLVVPSEGLPLSRKSDMLGHVASPEFLVEQAAAVGVLEADQGDLDADYAQLIALAQSGQADAVYIVHRAGRNIGHALVNAINLLDFDCVVFGGPYWDAIAELVLPVIEAVVNSPEHRETEYVVRLENSIMGKDVVAIGAGALVLDTMLSPHPSSLLVPKI